MFCMLKAIKKFGNVVARRASRLAHCALAWLERAWRSHARRVATDPAYAAAAAIVLGACMGFAPVRDAVAAVLAVLLGVHMNSRRARDSYGSGVSRWNTNEWDSDYA